MGILSNLGDFEMKHIGIVLLSFFYLFGGDYHDIDWALDYRDAIKEAKSSKKSVMVLITSKYCKWCKKLKRETLSNDIVIDRVNREFVAVEVRRGAKNYPYRHLRARVVPTIYFLYNNGKPIMRPVRGYWSVENFLSYLDDAQRRMARKRKD